MKQQERDELVRDIARRVFSEEQSGRPVDAERLLWAGGVLDQQRQAGEVRAMKLEGVPA